LSLSVSRNEEINYDRQKGVLVEGVDARAYSRRMFQPDCSGRRFPLYKLCERCRRRHALHKELVDSGKMTNRAFHDTILKENRIPIEMARAILTKQKLTRDFKSSWKFYGPVSAQLLHHPRHGR